jgi:hypothetical protein
MQSNFNPGSNPDPGRLIPRKQVAAELGVCPRLVAKRENSDPDFPSLVKVNGRVYVTESGLAAYKQSLIRRGAGER